MFRFRLFGIPYEITPYFWLGSAILGAGVASGENGVALLAVWILCVFVSIVAHEHGHALAARHYGIQPFVVLYQFGGLTYLPGERLTRRQSIVVSLAGPAAGFLVYLIVRSMRHFISASGAEFFYTDDTTGLLARSAVSFLLYANGLWTLFNLLPILPLDGGQVLRDVLGPSRIRLSRIIGALCAAICCVLAIKAEMFITAFFVGYLAYANFTGATASLPGGTQKG